MNIQKIDLNTSFLSLYIEKGQGLVFEHVEKKLYKISSIIVAFVCAIDDGLSESEAINEASLNCTASYQQLLLFYQEAKSFFTHKVSHKNYSDGEYPELTALVGLTRLDDNVNNKTYIVAETSFSISCVDSTLFKQITELLQPITTKCLKVHFQICIRKSAEDNHFDIFCNDLLIEQRLLILEVLPLLIDRIQIISFQHSNYCFCFHGAALQTYKGTLLIPGKSGVGKSTLSAALSTQQNTLYSDEMIVLDEYFNTAVLKLPIAIKSGSWDVLSQKFPELRELPEFLRLDGRRLKYVWPHSFAKQKKGNEVVEQRCLIVNPNYSNDERVVAVKEKLTVMDTISMLIGGGYQIGFELNEEKLEALLAFIEKANCFSLSYHTTEQAEYELKAMWGV